jgi:hypothetical protein
MPFVPVPDAAKAALIFHQYGQKLVNTLWFKKSGGWSETDLNSLATALNSWVVTEMLPIQPPTVTYNGCEAVDMSAAGQEGVSVPVTTGNTGGSGIAGLPTNVTVAVKFLTGLTGRSNRGRNYYIGLNTTAVTGDSLTTGLDALILDIYNSLGSYLVDLAADHVVASLYSGVDSSGRPIPRTTGVTHTVVTYAMDTALDSMRRRLIGRGE